RELRLHLLEQQRKGFRPLRQANPLVDRRLARVIERCLAYNPNDRHGSAAELAAALRRSLSWVCRQRRWAALHPWHVGAVALVALTIGITAAGVITSRDPLPVRLSQEGAAAYAEGKYDDAADYFEQSYRKSRDPKTLLKLVHVWIQLDKTDDALKTL